MPRSLLVLRLLAALGLFAALYGATVAPLVRGLGLLQIMREMSLMMPRLSRRPGSQAEPDTPIEPRVEP